MFRRVPVAVVVLSAAVAPAMAATLGPTSPMRPSYPHLHLNSPLNSHIAPRADREPWANVDCIAIDARSKGRNRKHSCRRDDRD